MEAAKMRDNRYTNAYNLTFCHVKMFCHLFFETELVLVMYFCI